MDEVLVIENLTVVYTKNGKRIKAVDRVDLKVNQGDMIGIVGESGSGKSTLAHAVMGLLPSNGFIAEGKIRLLGYEITRLNDDEMRKIRWKEFSMVFQKSMNALSPVHKIGEQMKEAVIVHEPEIGETEVESRMKKVLDMVNLPHRVLKSYPHELSGGMMQRVMIALALINNPKFVIFDEATTALDVVTQGQILDEIKNLVERLSLTGMVITHDIGVVAEICNKIAVMYAGRIVEEGPKEKILYDPLHPYTKALISSHPELAEGGSRMRGIPGNLPDLSKEIKGCVFAERCPHAEKICFDDRPGFVKISGRKVACFKIKEVEE